MHLKALKLHGFKSFADNTTLSFQPGVTAIVGPNGCGKSNIADAIRWVLGEQSAKALRGGKMQDVIFEGADTRKAAQFSEVALLLTDCEKQLGSEFHEIEIMRRVNRDGGGEYYFNGQPCRLKDIHKLFMDNGVGRTSYSIMAQGQIDQILSSKPEERRVVFEEAAGITKYKSQRREAMNKLALTEQNLARVSDVINEVARQIGSLKRQAAKAMRYKRLNFRLRHLALAQSGYQYGQLSAILADLDGRVASLREAADTRRATLEERSQKLNEGRTLRNFLGQRVQDAQQAVFDLKSQKEAAENAANMAQVKRTALAERIEAGKDSVHEIVGKVWPYILAGIAVGAAIHGWVPEDFMAAIMGKDAWWSVPLAVAIGVPMYTNAAGVIPVVQALLAKGAALGTVLAFMMSVIALSLPEMIILRKVLKPRLIATFAAVVAAGILAVGYVFNALL